MVAAAKTNLGKIPCPCCGDPVALKRSATGKLSYACQDAECESTGFADQHSGAARKWLAKLPVVPAPIIPPTMAAQNKPASAPKPPPATPKPEKAPDAPPPPKKAPASPFNLLGV